jgi:PAP2 superfamily
MRTSAHDRHPRWADLRRRLVVARGARPAILAAAAQTALIAAAALAYFGVRNLTQGDLVTATANGARVSNAEQALGMEWGDDLQDAILGHPRLVTAANWVYIWGHWPVIIASLFWLHHRYPDAFRTLRNAIFISGAIGLIIFATFPVAPPRLVSRDLVDTVTLRSSSYRALQPPGLVNRYAAMPSLHFGWDLLVGLTLLRTSRALPIRLLGVILPIAMSLAVVATANHYVLDLPAGAIVALTGLALVPTVERLSALASQRWRN